MLIWRGLGCLAPIIFIVVIGLAYGIKSMIWNNDLSHENWMFLLVSTLIAAIINFVLGVALNREEPKMMKDAKSGQMVLQKQKHDFYFLEMQYWSFIFFLGIMGFVGFQNYKQSSKAQAKEDFRQNHIDGIVDKLKSPQINDLYEFRIKYRDPIKKYEAPLQTIYKLVGMTQDSFLLKAPYSNPLKGDELNYDKVDAIKMWKKAQYNAPEFRISKKMLDTMYCDLKNCLNYRGPELSTIQKDAYFEIHDIHRPKSIDLSIQYKKVVGKKVKVILRNTGFESLDFLELETFDEDLLWSWRNSRSGQNIIQTEDQIHIDGNHLKKSVGSFKLRIKTKVNNENVDFILEGNHSEMSIRQE